MPSPPKRPPQTKEECAATARESIRKDARGIYKVNGKQIDSSVVSDIVEQLRIEYIEGAERTLNKTSRAALINRPHDVFTQIVEYLEVCRDVGKIPDMSGLSKKFGTNRENMYKYMRIHPDSESTKLLQMFIDTCSEAMTQSAMSNAVNPIVAIFTLKARYGWKEATEVLVTPNNPMGSLQSPEDIAQKYGYLPQAEGANSVALPESSAIPVSDVVDSSPAAIAIETEDYPIQDRVSHIIETEDYPMQEGQVIPVMEDGQYTLDVFSDDTAGSAEVLNVVEVEE